MANQLVFKFISDTKALQRGIGTSKKQLSGLEKATQKIGRSMTKALGAVGVGIGVGALVSQLSQATKAAAEDSKSQVLLAKSMQNTIGATDGQIASTEEYIRTLQLQTAILDDDLRPAMSTLVGVTGDVTKAQQLLALATDVSAGTGKDLQTVTNAIAKSFGGQTTALNKLVPGIKNAADPMKELERRFGGMAETAAQNDPYARLNVIFSEMQEQIGAQLLPYLEEFSTYMASEEGQTQLKAIVDTFTQIVAMLAQTIGWLVQNKTLVIGIVASIAILRVGWIAATATLSMYKAGTISATIATRGLQAAIASTGIGLLITGLSTLATISMPDTSEKMNVLQIALEEMEAIWGRTPEKMQPFLDGLDENTDRITKNTNAALANIAALAGETYDPSKAATSMRYGDPEPLNPKPNDVWTYYNVEGGLPVYYTVTWTGKGWSKPKKVVYRDTEADSKKNAALQAIETMTKKIKAAGEKFRESMDLSSNLSENGDFFNVEMALSKVRKVLAAAKKVPALLQQLRAKGASPTMLQDIFAMGPVGAAATADALLQSGSLGEFISSEKQLQTAGMKAGAIAGADTGGKTYSININKANMTAEEIIAAIQKYEKKSGRKVVFG